MKEVINIRTGLLPIEKAYTAANELQIGDPDWKYKVVDCNNGKGRIDVFDEDGEIVVRGFLPV